ncbi:MAG: Mur ligase family protein [Candidatus Shapirobacteria bacterium]
MKKYLSLFILYYLRFFAKLQLLKNKKMVIVGITGSAGKSSTVSVCEAALSSKYKIKTNNGTNSESGIPLSILGIKVSGYSTTDWLKYCLIAPIKLFTNWQKYDIYLCEMGIDGPDIPKNMVYLLSIVKPKIGIFLNVNLVHGEFFKDIYSIGLEKSKLIATLPSTGYALINTNDPIVAKTTQNTLAKKIYLKPIHINFEKFAPPASFDISISAAINLAEIFDINRNNAIDNIKNYLVLPPGRSSLLSGINNSTIIDSSYNSSPLACSEMLAVLKNSLSPRIAILGDMRELGIISKSAHQQIYNQALKSCDTIISIGKETSQYFGDKAIKFLNYVDATNYLKENLPKNSTILVKGSQNTIFLEELVKSILQNPADSSKLCRQSPYWMKTKNII